MDTHGRKAERIPLHAEIDFRRTGEHRWRVNVIDVSPEGCRVELPVRVKPGDIIWITFPGLEAIQGKVAWVDEWVAGIEFSNPLYPSVFEMVERRMRKGE